MFCDSTEGQGARGLGSCPTIVNSRKVKEGTKETPVRRTSYIKRGRGHFQICEETRGKGHTKHEETLCNRRSDLLSPSDFWRVEGLSLKCGKKKEKN